MPVVPFTSAPGVRGVPSRSPADEPFTLMAAAQMHSEGRLIAPKDKSTPSVHFDDNVINPDKPDLGTFSDNKERFTKDKNELAKPKAPLQERNI